MSQHDYDLANQSRTAFRADLNNALLAIVSQNSGATAPTTTYAYQWWADTTTGLLKIRNAANSAWITVGTLADAYLGLLPLSGGTLTGLLTFKKGADIASAATLDLTAATGNLIHITGTAATSAVTMNSGQAIWCVADAAWPLTYHATNNKINSGGVNKTLAAGDMVMYYYDGTTKYGLIIKADGTAVVAPASLQKYVGSFTRDVSLASGTQVISGLTFEPKVFVFFAALSNTIAFSAGVDDAVTHGAVVARGAGSYITSANGIQLETLAGTDIYAGVVSAKDSSSFTITWTKIGSPTGLATVYYHALG